MKAEKWFDEQKSEQKRMKICFHILFYPIETDTECNSQIYEIDIDRDKWS